MLLADEAILVGPLFCEMLQRVGEIAYAEFSFAMYGTGYDSYIDFGQPNFERICGEKNCQV